MNIEISDILQILGSLASLILIPIWRSINSLKDSQNKTNIILAKDYVTKKECCNMHSQTHADIVRLHGRIDEVSSKK